MLHKQINIIWFIVVYNIGFSENVDIIDLSFDCKNNLKSNYFLTNGLGSADGINILFANKGLNCTINLYTKPSAKNIYQILILDEFDSCNNLSIVVDGQIKINPCKYLIEDKSASVNVFNNSKSSITIKRKYFGRLKLLATSSNVLLPGNSCKKYETLCRINDINLCLSSELRCEFYKFCGRSSLEIAKSCGIKTTLGINRELIFAIIAGIIFLILLIFMIYRLFYRCMPKLPNRFFKSIHHEDIKLIVGTQVSPKSKKKVGLKQITTNMPNNSKKKVENVMDDSESELTEFIYNPTTRNAHKKRQTTNTPVFRNSRVATILLESITDLQNDVESTPQTSTESESVIIEDSFNAFPKKKRHIK